MTRFIIHAGSHKTGTTTFQNALGINRKNLQSQGIYYPDTSVFVGGSVEAHHNIAHALSRYSTGDKLRLSKLKRHLARACEKYHTILISSEAFYRQIALPPEIVALNLNNNTISEQDFSRHRKVYLERMREYFSDFNPTITLYFRRPDEFAESLYSSNVVGSQLKMDFDEFLGIRTFRFKYAEQLSDFRECFSKVSCFSFDERKQGNLLKNLFEDHGLGEPKIATTSNLRKSVSNRGTMWMLREKKEQNLSLREIKRRHHFALLESGSAIFSEDNPSSYWPSMGIRNRFVERSLNHFDAINFDVSSIISPPVVWNDDMHAEAHQKYQQWISDNIRGMERREKLNIPPYIVDYDIANLTVLKLLRLRWNRRLRKMRRRILNSG